MSWIAITDLNRPAFNIRGIGVSADTPGARPPAAPYEIMPTGTLMLELTYGADPGTRWKVLQFRRNVEWQRDIVAAFDEAGRFALTVRQGQARSRAVLALPPIARESRLRVSYSWHAPMRAARLAVELLDEGRMFVAEATNPVPLPVGDVNTMIRNGGATTIEPGVRYVAVSDEIEPVGFGTGIAGDTPVETPDGPVSVDRLRLGDLVSTATSGPQPVRWIGRRTVPALGAFRPIRLRAPFFGLGRDVVVAPDHRVRLDFEEAEYMLGSDEVLLPARHLVNGKHARRDSRGKLVTYFQVLLDIHDCLLHDGIWSESLFVGSIARRPTLAKSTVLADMPASAIPVHRGFARHRLSNLEARSLAASLQLA